MVEIASGNWSEKEIYNMLLKKADIEEGSVGISLNDGSYIVLFPKMVDKTIFQVNIYP